MKVVCINDKPHNCEPEFEPVKFMETYTVVNSNMPCPCKCGFFARKVFILAEMPMNTYYDQDRFAVMNEQEEPAMKEKKREVDTVSVQKDIALWGLGSGPLYLTN